MRAFVLGAGLGKRLRPLTDLLPKPLIPVWQHPLISHAFEHMLPLGVREIVVNTHHLPATYAAAFPASVYPSAGGHSIPLHFRHEPVLLETGGGLANVKEFFQDEPFLVYNGDILTDLPLERALAQHSSTQSLVTLILRSEGAVRNVAFDPDTGRVLDLRNALQTHHPLQFQFTGLYVVSPAFFRYLIPGKIESMVEGFLRALQAGERLGGVVMDEGHWWDLGDPASYLEAHAAYRQFHPTTQQHPTAVVSPQAQVDATSCISADCHVAPGSQLRNTLLWPGAHIGPNTQLLNCIVRPGPEITGAHQNAIL